MIRTSQIYDLARMYLEAEINTWENIEAQAGCDPRHPMMDLNIQSSRRSLACYKMLLNDLVSGNIVDDMTPRFARFLEVRGC